MSSRVNAIYESVLLEMDERIIDYLNEHIEDLPFDHIFGPDDLRITIPIYNDPTAKEILDTLKRIRDYGGLDLDSGEVVRKIKLDPKYGRGDEKEQRMKITSAVSKLKISDEEKRKYLDWLALYKDNIKQAMSGDYSIVVSRAPIDVIRMGDFDIVDYSCHNPRGSYFECAVQEAINGGAVAYVVETKELENTLTGWGLQEDDFFYDRDRDAGSGLDIIARLRLRRLVSENENEIAIPDKKVYGDQTIPGFYKTLRAFLQEKQSITFDEFLETKWEQRGGTYYDGGEYGIAEMLTQYFDKSPPYYGYSYGYKTNHSYDDYRSEGRRKRELYEILNTLDEECSEIQREFNEKMVYCEVTYDVQYSEGVYIEPYANGRIDFNLEGVDFSEVSMEFDGNEIEEAKNGNWDDDIQWSGLVYWVDHRCHQMLDKLEFEGNVLKMGFKHPEYIDNSDNYRQFCQNIDDFDTNIANMDDDKWIEIFKEIGIIPDIEGKEQFNRLIENKSDYMEYTNELYNEKSVNWTFYLDTKPKEVIAGYDTKVEHDESVVSDRFANMLIKFIEIQYTPPVEPESLPSFNEFFESYIPKLKYNDVFYDNDLKTIYTDLYDSGNVIMFTLKLEVEKFTKTNVDLLLWLDKAFKDLENMATLAYLTTSRNISQDPYEKTDVNDLKRRLVVTYGKFLN